MGRVGRKSTGDMSSGWQQCGSDTSVSEDVHLFLQVGSEVGWQLSNVRLEVKRSLPVNVLNEVHKQRVHIWKDN